MTDRDITRYFFAKQKIEEKGLTEEQVRKLISAMLLFNDSESIKKYADFLDLNISVLDTWYQIFRKK